MPYAALIGTVVKLVGGAGGAYLQGRAGDIQKKELQRVADIPGVDPNAVYSTALGANQAANPQAQAIASQQNTFNQSELDKQLAQEIPGYQGGQAQRTQNAISELHGEIPLDVSQQVQRNTASQAASGGYVGSPFARALNARDLGKTSLDLTNLGGQNFASIIGSTPRAPLVTSGSLLDIDPKTDLALQDHERSQRLDILLKRAGVGGQTQAWANYLGAASGTAGNAAQGVAAGSPGFGSALGLG